MANEDFDLGVADREKGKDTFQDLFKTNLDGNDLMEKEKSPFSDISPIGIFEDAHATDKLTVEWKNAFADLGVSLDMEPSEESDMDSVLPNDQNFEGKEEEVKAKNTLPEDRAELTDDMVQSERSYIGDLSDVEKDDVGQERSPELLGLPPIPKPFLDLANEVRINEKSSDDDPSLSEERQGGVVMEVEDPNAEMLIDADGQVWPQEELNAPLIDTYVHLDEVKMEKQDDPVMEEKQVRENVSLQQDAQPLEYKLTIKSAEEVFEKIELETHVALNPITNKTTVYFSKKGKKELLLLDATGKIFNQWMVEETKFEMPLIGLTSGAYFLKVRTDVAIVTVLKLEVV